MRNFSSYIERARRPYKHKTYKHPASSGLLQE